MRVLEKQKLVCNLMAWGAGEEVQMFVREYPNGRVGLQLMSQMEDMPEGHLEPFSTPTVNMVDAPCPDNEVYVKDWSENEGMVKQLVEWKVIEPGVTHFEQSGYVTVGRYRFTASFLVELGAALTKGKEKRKC